MKLWAILVALAVTLVAIATGLVCSSKPRIAALGLTGAA
jgi:hypothetical protein